ncbi:hypothetical protein [Sphingobium yanoikuyae]|uniref:Uncharacterized protein n=1 Tax=Sphingobium yanoikuyae ATCC 51230 TaxID=883163 RepID=K9CY99_SPHYA|nr:hypothetical protein [Sphingobium yanoikuyae]EKU75856.1 hypothetical protein HMPREF9718_01208 [Sphingobium yanoikuyae ATCC 51230]WQE05641.1 hypothetical protein U0025_15115 [Sphingobium yanoikuyae]
MSESGSAELCSDIYDILERCTNDEIAPIVNMLVASPASAFKLTRAFERYAPDHGKYADQIGDEVYRLALTALARSDGQRPTYSAMLEGVSKQIGLSIDVGDNSKNEANLLNCFASQHILTVPIIDRQRIVEEAAAAASRAASGILSSDAWQPFASALLQLGYLRRKLVDEGRMSRHEPDRLDCNLVSAGDGSDALVIHMGEGEPFLSMANLPADGAGWLEVNQNTKVSGLLYPMLEAIQPVMAGVQMLRNDTLWKEGAKNATASIVQAGQQGIVKSLGHVSVASLVGPTAVLVLASAMIEQQKLEQIEKSLAEIKTSLSDISKFQKGERRSILTGSIRYFQQIAESVLTGELAEEVLHSLERHEIDLMRVQDHLSEEVRDQIVALRAIKKEGWGSGKYAKAIQDRLVSLDKAYDELFLCIRARACAYMLLCAFPGREAGKRSRLNDIKDVLDAFSPSGDATAALDRDFREKIQVVSSLELRGQLLSQENMLLNRAMQGQDNILDGLSSASQKAATEATPLALNIKLEDGRPVAFRAFAPTLD